jgi:arylformamidase
VIRYGADARHEIAFYPAKGLTAAPLVIAFGGRDVAGWPRYQLNHAGVSLAIVSAENTVLSASKSVADYTAAVARLYRDADKLGIDRTRIVLYGTDRTAGMALLFGMDPALLSQAGVPFESLRGVISDNGEDFDLIRRSRESAYFRAFYRRYYGDDDTKLAALSPTTHVAPPNAPAFLMLANERDVDQTRESRLMVDALGRAGTSATFVALPDKHEGVRKTYFLAEQGGSGWEIIDFVRKALGLKP